MTLAWQASEDEQAERTCLPPCQLSSLPQVHLLFLLLLLVTQEQCGTLKTALPVLENLTSTSCHTFL